MTQYDIFKYSWNEYCTSKTLVHNTLTHMVCDRSIVGYHRGIAPIKLSSQIYYI